MGDEGGEQGPEEGDEYPCSGRDVPGGPGYQGPSPHWKNEVRIIKMSSCS